MDLASFLGNEAGGEGAQLHFVSKDGGDPCVVSSRRYCRRRPTSEGGQNSGFYLFGASFPLGSSYLGADLNSQKRRAWENLEIGPIRKVFDEPFSNKPLEGEREHSGYGDQNAFEMFKNEPRDNFEHIKNLFEGDKMFDRSKDTPNIIRASTDNTFGEKGDIFRRDLDGEVGPSILLEDRIKPT